MWVFFYLNHLSVFSYRAMTQDRYYVYMLDDSFDVRDTHTLGFIRKYHYEVCSFTQTVDPPP